MASSSSNGKTLRRSRPDSILGKTLLAYHGWYTCPGDGQPLYQGHHGWHKWFEQPIPAGGHPRFDLWPDVSSYDAKELYPVPGLTLPNSNGEPAKLFSSRNPATIKRHFHLMAEHGIDGVFVMRNANELAVDNDSWSPLANLMRISDEILDGVMKAAEAEGRVWALMYDLTGVPAHKIADVLRYDWGRLVVHKRLLNSPSYLREQGRPVIGLKGLGIKGAYQDPAVILDIIRQFRTFTPGGAYVIGGVSSSWRTPFEGDNDGNPGFEAVHRELDAISPWSIGRSKDVESADWYAVDMREDVKLIKKWNEETSGRKRIDYIPIVFPGLSRGNLYTDAQYNEIPRKSGTFLWRQVYHCQREGAHGMIVASFDDLNTGTAVMPITPLGRLLPNERRFLALDGDGDTSLPSDWYLRICGMAGEAIRGEKRIATDLMPKKELDDYWAMRPKYEEDQQTTYNTGSSSSASAYDATSSMADSSAAGSSSTAGASGSAGPSQPMRAGTVDYDNLLPPPPAYSLVDEGPETVTAEPEALSNVPTQTPAPTTAAPISTPAPTAPRPSVSQVSAPAPAPSTAVVPPTPATPSASSASGVVVVQAPSLNRPPTPVGASQQQRPIGPGQQPILGRPSPNNTLPYGQPSVQAPTAGLAAGMENLSLGSSSRPPVLGGRTQSTSPQSQATPLPNSSYGPSTRPWSPGQQASNLPSTSQPGPGSSYPQPQPSVSSNAGYGSQSSTSHGPAANSSYGTQSNSSYGAPGGSNSFYAMPGVTSNSTYGSMDSTFGAPGRPGQTDPGFAMPGHGPTRMDSSAPIGGFASPELVRINSGRMAPPPLHPNRPGGNRPVPVASSPFGPPAASSPFGTPPLSGGFNSRPPQSPPIPGAPAPGNPGSYPLPGENPSSRPNASYGPSTFGQPTSAGPGPSQFPTFSASPQISPGPSTAPLPSSSSHAPYGQPAAPAAPSPPCGSSPSHAPYGQSSGPSQPCSSSYNPPKPAAPHGASSSPFSQPSSSPFVQPSSSSFSQPSTSMFPSTSSGPSNRPPGGYPQPASPAVPGRQDSASSASSTVIPTPKPFGVPNNLLNPARHAFDKYAGEERRKQFEKGVDSAFQMGTKWLGKFGK